MSNNTLNFTTPSSSIQPGTSCEARMNQAARIGLTVAHVLVLLAAVTGNSFVIHLIRTKNKMKVSFNFLVVNMAIADMIDAIFSVPNNIAYLYVEVRWFPGFFGLFLCKVSNFIILVCILVSTTTMTVIAIERYLATTKVLKRPLSLPAVKLVIAVIWILAGLMSVTELIRMDLVYLYGQYFCSIHSDWRKYLIIEMVIKFAITYAFPVWTMTILYSIIVCLLWKKAPVGEEIDEYNRRLHKQKKGIIKKLVTIVIIFALGWLPVHIMHFIGAFNTDIYMCVPEFIKLIFFWLAHANSAINPFLYLMLTKNSRALFKAHISGIIRGEGSSGRGSNRRDKQRAHSLLMWKRSSKKTTKTVVI
ncbi:substance-K receptor-like [Actinia tenebrosa]|uniref:Substance-K receptor-like n=1 Tax=Actinia tenebrosa TaxID=6105 RepID=A0A6P8IHK9_ACTTE|nr:substance-K receptor-like [Actinia tenebrosa]XP_031566280.1 substance-K receptor-like [Actinia tenebrosa]XP_031566281.1 substance-K receptor-like [Actinia tenebrosa]XP_031566282.1 substance-K receptor-like [Actinia tenebrosa]XP_031566283.1 substance-K receptor-like [Actinia tenebrosa]